MWTLWALNTVPYTPCWSSDKFVPAGIYSICSFGKIVLPNTNMWNFIETIHFLYNGNFVSRENVNIRDKIFQESLIKKFRVLLGIEIRSAIPHFIPHKSLWKIMWNRMRNIIFSTRTLFIRKWNRKICNVTTRNIQWLFRPVDHYGPIFFTARKIHPRNSRA